MKRVASEKSRKNVSKDTPLDVCTLNVVEKIGLGFRPGGRLLYPVCCIIPGTLVRQQILETHRTKKNGDDVNRNGEIDAKRSTDLRSVATVTPTADTGEGGTSGFLRHRCHVFLLQVQLFQYSTYDKVEMYSNTSFCKH